MKRNSVKGVLMAAAVLLGAGLFVPCRATQAAEPQECDFRSVSGTVAAVNWVGDVLVVDTGLDGLSLVVSRDTEFRKGASRISFSELNKGDRVTVRFYDCGFAGLKALTVTVTSGV